MQDENIYIPHEGWVSVDKHGLDKFNSFEDGRSKYDAPILLDQMWVIQHMSNLEGKILTLIEATVVKDQQKGTKDLARGYFGELMADVINATQTDEYTELMIRECNQSEFKK